MTRGEIAKNYFMTGGACAHAVLLSFVEETGAPKEFLRAVSLPMGGGLGRLRETCGCVSGGAMALGLLFPELEKKEIYALVQEFAKRFKEKHGSLNCGQLLTGAGLKVDTAPTPEARTAEYYKKRPCPELVSDAAEIVEALYRERKGK